MRGSRLRPALLALGCLLAAPMAWSAGSVQVSFKPAHELADVGAGLDRERNVRTLAAYFEQLARRLPDGQTLTVEVLDVDMAGEMRPTRSGPDVRVLRGMADWPRMHLRWRLAEGSNTLRSGDDQLSDMGYLNQPLRGAEDTGLGYEKRLVDRWFNEQVLGKAAH